MAKHSLLGLLDVRLDSDAAVSHSLLLVGLRNAGVLSKIPLWASIMMFCVNKQKWHTAEKGLLSKSKLVYFE